MMMMMYMIVLLFMFGCLLEVYSLFDGCLYCCKCGAWDLSDPYLFVGEYLEMNCILDQETVEKGDNASKILFSYGNDIPVPEEEMVIVNSSTRGIRSFINSTFDRAYFCLLKANESETVITASQTVATTMVETEYPPQPVTNFTCIIYDWDERIECSWDLGVEYRKLSNINTTLYLAYSGYCKNMYLLNCTWIKDNMVSFDRSILYFRVTVTNTKRSVSISTDWIILNQQDCVQPKNVDYLYVTTLSCCCVRLEWMHSRRYREKMFVISVNSTWNDNKEFDSDDTNMTVCDLEPNTQYEFSIVTRPGKYIGYPSDPVVNYTVTFIDQPDSSPEMSNGGYYIENMDCTNGRWNITLYWKKLEYIFHNGPFIEYCVKVDNSDDEECTSQQYQSLSLPCNRESVLSILSQNEAGYAIQPSTITIPKASSIPLPPRIIVEAENSSAVSVSVSWTTPDIDGIKSYTVYYCQYDTECTTEIEWVETNETAVTIKNIQFDRKHRFGVSINVDGYSSGFKWETCYYLKSVAPQPPSFVQTQAYPENGLTVTWPEPPCGQSPYIAFYRITWCLSSHGSKQCSGEIKEKDIQSTGLSGRYVIDNLKPRSTYGIRIQHITEDGRLSDYSEMVYAAPTNNDLLQSEIIGLSVAGVFIFMLAVAGACFIYRRFVKGIKEIRRPLEIETLQIKKSQARKNDQWSNGSMSSGSSSGDQNSTTRLIRNKGAEYKTQLSKDSGRSSINSDALQSPVDCRLADLFPVAEEPSVDKEFKSDQKKNLAIISDPDYSKIGIEEISSHEVFNQNFPAYHCRASYPNINQKSQSLDRVSHLSKTSSQRSHFSNGTLSWKSSSDEKILLNEDPDEEGYLGIDARSKSSEVVYSRTPHSGSDKVDSYVKYKEVCMDSTATDATGMDSASSFPFLLHSDGKMSKDFIKQGIKDLPSMELNTARSPKNFDYLPHDQPNQMSSPEKNSSLRHSDYLPIEESSTVDCDDSSDASCDLVEIQDSKHNKVVYHRNDSTDLQVLPNVLTPLMEEDSMNNGGYVSEENFRELTQSNENSDYQDSMGTGYVSETKAITMNCVGQNSKNSSCDPIIPCDGQNNSVYTPDQDFLNSDSSLRNPEITSGPTNQHIFQPGGDECVNNPKVAASSNGYISHDAIVQQN